MEVTHHHEPHKAQRFMLCSAMLYSDLDQVGNDCVMTHLFCKQLVAVCLGAACIREKNDIQY